MGQGPFFPQEAWAFHESRWALSRECGQPRSQLLSFGSARGPWSRLSSPLPPPTAPCHGRPRVRQSRRGWGTRPCCAGWQHMGKPRSVWTRSSFPWGGRPSASLTSEFPLSTYWAEKPQTSRGLESLKFALGAMKLTLVFRRTCHTTSYQELGDKLSPQVKAPASS